MLFVLSEVLSMLQELGAKMGQLLPLIRVGFFPLRMHFGGGNGTLLQYVCVHTYFSFEALSFTLYFFTVNLSELALLKYNDTKLLKIQESKRRTHPPVPGK